MSPDGQFLKSVIWEIVCLAANEHNVVWVWYMAMCQVMLVTPVVHLITGLFMFRTQFIAKKKKSFFTRAISLAG